MGEENRRHIPVMLQEVMESLQPAENMLVVDATFGAGGYANALLEAGAHVIALDRDRYAIEAGASLRDRYGERLQLIHSRFSRLYEEVKTPVDAIVFDIGVSSMQIDEGRRGFSFQKDGPLDMRMSNEGVSAADIVNYASVPDLVRIFRCLGEEKHSLAIARMIDRKRRQKLFTGTLELSLAVEALLGAYRGRGARSRGKSGFSIHPATRIFQALRIYVNDELGELTAGLIAAEKRLRPGGRLVVVSFHSLEDRIVKQFFNARAIGKAYSRHLPETKQLKASFTLPFRGAKVAGEVEKAQNPRARSAKLRVGVRSAAPPHEANPKIFRAGDLPALSSFFQGDRS